ncbi:MAG TPA: thioredoxin domain-containing protein [Galbitalea sp.]|jgi:protein-disulfide isomerase|nr:thioredoxin domain-containing protein [Galbitalea sp.]
MTYGEAGDRGGTNQRREAAREKARELRDLQRKKEKRNRFLLQGGIIVGVLVILGVIALVVTTSISPPAAGPLNMRSDGIVIGKDLKAVRTAAIPENGKPTATVRDKKSNVVSIRIYLDYFCPVCNAFETANKTQLTSWLEKGAVTLEIHPISILDRSSLGTAYSTRAANAAACVANYAPDDYWAFTQEMYARQPAENTVGLSNSQILAVIKDAKVHDIPQITTCVNKEKFKGWVAAATTRAQNGPLPDSSVKSVSGTPTVIVDGVEYPITDADVGSASAFAAFVEQTAGSQFNAGTSTPKPTPTPTPTS